MKNLDIKFTRSTFQILSQNTDNIRKILNIEKHVEHIYTTSNGFKVNIYAYPAFYSYSNVIYLRGSREYQNDDIVTDLTPDAKVALKELMAKVNRTNNVKILL